MWTAVGARFLVRVAVPVPVRSGFDYRCDAPVAPGCRVLVPHGGRRLVGLVTELPAAGAVPAARLKSVEAVMDRAPLVSAPLLQLLLWAADYYQHPVGEVCKAALPGLLGTAPRTVSPSSDPESPSSDPESPFSPRKPPSPPLSAPQRTAVDEINRAAGGFAGFVLHGVTGSGKTEVYIAAAADALRRGRRALVLVPEIGLTPQIVARFQKSLGGAVGVFHSALRPAERRDTWCKLRGGFFHVALGTRSAVFAPVDKLGVIIVDEEHDSSYKQQEGFRYHARDLAVLRARLENVPVMLGSATPSLETLLNVRQKKYRALHLPARIGAAKLPRIALLDLRKLPLVDGLTPPLADAMEQRLRRGEQSLLFANRRGFAPVLLCTACGWQARCDSCDARLVLHGTRARNDKLACHHCGAGRAPPDFCPQCCAPALRRIGHGTQRLEESLRKRFPAAVVERIDRDSVRKRGALAEKLKRAQSGAANILVGTRMLGKGHDFPRLTLVGVVDVDRGFYSADFRALETQVQQLLQVAGRAGRAEAPGEVMIQTVFPDNPVLQLIARHDFNGFAEQALAERESAGFPPYRHFALLRAESETPGAALAFLAQVKKNAGGEGESDGVALMDPVPSPMEKRRGRHRAQLLVQSPRRKPLGDFLRRLIRAAESRRAARKVRWSVDVDPMEML